MPADNLVKKQTMHASGLALLSLQNQSCLHVHCVGQLCLLHSPAQRSPATPGPSSAMLPSIPSWDCCLQESSTRHTEVCVALTQTLLDNCLLAEISPLAFAKVSVAYQIFSVYEKS